MLKKITEIENCKSLSLKKIGNYLLYTIGELTYVNNISMEAYIPVSSFSIFENKLYFINDSKLFEVFQNKSIERFSFEDADFLKIVGKNIILFHKRVSRKELQYSFYDFDYNLLWSKTDNEFLEIIDGVVLCNERFNKTKFEVKNIDTGRFLWNFITKEELNIEGNFIVHKNILVFSQVQKSLSNSSKVLLTGLNIHSGEKIWELPTFSDYNLLKKENGLLYSFASSILGDNFLTEIDVIKGTLNKTVFENFKGNTKPHLCAIDGEILYFSDNQEGCGIGIIDIIAKKLNSTFSIGLREGTQIGKPDVFEGKIYVLDTENILHIFEMESNSPLSRASRSCRPE